MHCFIVEKYIGIFISDILSDHDNQLVLYLMGPFFLVRENQLHYLFYHMKWNECCFRPRFCIVRLYWVGDNLGEWDTVHVMVLHCKLTLGVVEHGLMRWILPWIMPLAQDRSFYLLASSPAHYHCTTDTSYFTIWYLFNVLKPLSIEHCFLAVITWIGALSPFLQQKSFFIIESSWNIEYWLWNLIFSKLYSMFVILVLIHNFYEKS